MSKCRCGKEITWVMITKEDGKPGKVPVDLSAPVYRTFVTPNGPAAERLDPKSHGVNHFKTCAHGNDFNKSKPKPCTGESI